MQIPVEILPKIPIGAGSGTGGRQGMRGSGDSRFGDMLESALGISQASATQIQDSSEADVILKAENEPTSNNELEENNIAYENTVIVPVYQNEVVFILEVDKESATTPEMLVEPSTSADTEASNAADNMPVQEPMHVYAEQAATETRTTHGEVYEAVQNAVVAEQNRASETNNAHRGAAANTETIIPPEAVSAEIIEKQANGEVTARTPYTRTSNESEDTQMPGLSRNGELSHLENENDTFSVKEQVSTQTTYAAEADNDSKQEPAGNTVPLSGGLRPEQFRADQQMKQASFDAPVTVENLFDEMVSRLETMQTDSQRTMTIELKPEFLGKVALELAMDAAGLHVRISAVDSGVRAMINSQMTALIESLEHKGIEVVEVEVAYTGIDNGSFRENRENTPHSGNQRRMRREQSSNEGINFYTANMFDANDFYVEAGISSVEYSA